MKEKVLIIGAGLCGTLLAIRMAQRGYRVELHERRADLRKEEVAAGRSINLALSDRGLRALATAGIQQEVLQISLPMSGRMVHPLGGQAFLAPYSGRKGEHINSISRSGLNAILLDKAETLPNVSIHFNSSCQSVDIEAGTAVFLDDITREKTEAVGDILIGTDGAGSVVRRAMMARTNDLLFNYSQDFLRHGYKELEIPPTTDGGWQIEKTALHIWPRGAYMVIALPNMDGSFTVTMFHPFEGKDGFNNLRTPQQVQAFFEEKYPELIAYMPDYVADFFKNPTGTLGTIKCYPWQAFGKSLIMGDAAHAVVPFYGQGMNASFEDVRVFDEILENHAGDWETVFQLFQDARVQNANAIADLAIDNFYEMRDKVDDANFVKKRKLETQLEQNYPDYYSKYSLVTFRADVPYAESMRLGRLQDELLLDICANTPFDEISLDKVHAQVMALKR